MWSKDARDLFVCVVAAVMAIRICLEVAIWLLSRCEIEDEALTPRATLVVWWHLPDGRAYRVDRDHSLATAIEPPARGPSRPRESRPP